MLSTDRHRSDPSHIAPDTGYYLLQSTCSRLRPDNLSSTGTRSWPPWSVQQQPCCAIARARMLRCSVWGPSFSLSFCSNECSLYVRGLHAARQDKAAQKKTINTDQTNGLRQRGRGQQAGRSSSMMGRTRERNPPTGDPDHHIGRRFCLATLPQQPLVFHRRRPLLICNRFRPLLDAI